MLEPDTDAERDKSAVGVNRPLPQYEPALDSSYTLRRVLPHQLHSQSDLVGFKWGFDRRGEMRD